MVNEMGIKMSQIPTNYKNSVKWILGAYEDDGVTLPDGFQKDSIQNAVGARKWNNFKNWKCDISYKETDCGKFLVIEDSGTLGLTGANISIDEIHKIMARELKLPAEERLSRFTSMFNSDYTSIGPGLYGVGKTVYSAASETCKYYFDSLREDKKYVANVNDGGIVGETALEGDKAKKYIYKNTGLSEKETVGTRIIIDSPKKELVESIETGEIVKFIQESWWRIIQRLPEGAEITVNGEPVKVPDNIMSGTHVFELPRPEKYSDGYRVKNFGLFVFKDGDNQWSGISYYRKGMKIGEVEIKDVPKEVEGKFWGYIEVDEPWEISLAEIENNTHFGVKKLKKNNAPYRHLKFFCNAKFQEKLGEWGFIKNKESSDNKTQKALAEIADDVQDLFNKLGFESLGNGPQKPDFDVRWQNISFPVFGSERVTSGDDVSFSVRIKNLYTTDKKFEYSLYVVSQNTGLLLSNIDSGMIEVKSNTVAIKNFVHTINKENSEQYSENRIVLSVKVVGSGREKRKELPYFFDIDKPDNSRELVNLTLHECIFPVSGSRRVNFGEAIQNICYLIENKRNQILKYRLNISIHNANDPNCPKLVDVIHFEGEIKPFEDIVTPYIKKIIFDKETYEKYLAKGILELRARLIADEADGIFEKGDKITSYHYKIFLNCDEKSGHRNSFDPRSDYRPNDYRRSWCIPGNGRAIVINIGHPAYLSLKEEEQREYMHEEMLKQYVLLYLAEGKYDMFNEQGSPFSNLDPQAAVERVISTIERVYSESLK